MAMDFTSKPISSMCATTSRRGVFEPGRRNANADDQISGVIGLSRGPGGKQRTNCLANTLFVIAYAVGFC